MEKGLEQIIFVLKLQQELKWMNNLWIQFAIFTDGHISCWMPPLQLQFCACIFGVLYFSEPLKDQLHSLHAAADGSWCHCSNV